MRRPALRSVHATFSLLTAAALGLGCAGGPIVSQESALAPMARAEAVPALAAPAPLADEAGEPQLEASVGGAIASKYVWRGIVVTDDPVFQPSIDLTKWGVNLNIWANMDLGNANNNERQFNEVDFTLAYSRSFEQISVHAGLIHYMFPNTTFEDTTELNLGAGLDVLLNPSLNLYIDLDEAVGGNYWNLSGSHSLEMDPLGKDISWSLEFNGSIAYGSAKYHELYFGPKKDELSDLFLGVSAPLDLGKGVVLTPFLNFTSILGDKIRKAVKDEDNLVVGVSVSLQL